MRQRTWIQLGCCLALAMVPALLMAADRPARRITKGEFNPDHDSVEMFAAIEDGTIEVKLIPQDAKAARVLIENKSDRPLNVKLPEAFAGVPVLAQIGVGGGGRGGRGGGGGGQQFGGGFGGGGFGGGGGGFGGGGGGFGGGGGGIFNVPPEMVGDLKVACLCLEHGKPDPTSRMAYEIKPIEETVDRPAVIELVKAFARGAMERPAAQAAVWHLNNDLSWEELAAKRSNRRALGVGRLPYFQANEIRLAVQLAQQAQRQAANTETTTPGKADSHSSRYER